MTKVSKSSSQICVKSGLCRAFNCPSIPSSSAIVETKQSWRDLRVANCLGKEIKNKLEILTDQCQHNDVSEVDQSHFIAAGPGEESVGWSAGRVGIGRTAVFVYQYISLQ